MLLYENFCLLRQLNNGLSQASFSFARSFLHNGEITARLQNQLWFVSVCLRKGTLPPTVRNMPLPSCIGEASQRGIRLLVLKRMKRGLRALLETAKSKLRQLNSNLSSFPAADREQLQRGRSEAFTNSYRRASNHFQNKLHWLGVRDRRPDAHSEARGEPGQPRSSRVTDTTRSLSETEKDLLGKGPKFALAPAVNERMEEACRSSFSRFAYQYRWSCLLYTSPSPRDLSTSRMPSSA